MDAASSPRLALVADDFTGAMDASAPFATAGLRTVLVLDAPASPEWDVIALSTESRDLPAATAIAAVERAARKLVAAAPPNAWYKKIDSALRGHPGPEIASLVEVSGATRVLVAPALPSEGRVVRAGRVFVAGQPLEATRLGSGSSTSSVVERLGAESGIPVELVDLATVRGPTAELRARLAVGPPALLVADSETEEDLEALAVAATQACLLLCCGSAGLARHLAGPGGRSHTTVSIARPARPMLIVAGSQHETTAQQLAHAETHAGLRIVRPPSLDQQPSESELQSLAGELRSALETGSSVALTTSGTAHSPLGSAAIADLLSRIASKLDVIEAAGSLLLTGGDVAAAVCRAIGCTRVDVVGEAAPNIPLGLAVRPGFPSLPLVTKAGSFGREDVISRCLTLLTNGQRSVH